MEDIIQVEGINSKGFGTIPKLVMQDRRLCVQAKAIYGYFASYAGAGQSAFPSRSKIMADLNISKDYYYKGLNQLKGFGYIKAEQEKTPGGRFKRNVYTMLTDVPAPPFSDYPCPENKDSEPCPTIPDTAAHDAEPCPALPDTVENDAEPCPITPYTVEQDININSIKNKQLYFFKSNSLSSQSTPKSTPADNRQDGTDVTEKEIIALESLLKVNIGYEDLIISYPHDTHLVDEIIAIIVDVLFTPDKYVALDGESKPRVLVCRRLMALGFEDIEHTLSQFKGRTTPIKRKRQYLLTMLYNSKLELDAHYTNLVNSD